jgi:hypothetical protein
MLRARGRQVVVVIFALLVVAASGGPASAAGKTTPVAAKPKAGKGPAKGSITLYLPDAYFVGGQPVMVPNRTLHVGGVVRPFVRGQSVTVRSFLGSRLIKSDRLRIKRSRNGTYGRFTETLSSPGVGNVTVSVTHSRNSALQGFVAQRRFASLDQNIGFGSTGPFVQLIQQQLAALHLYIPQTGVYDQGTGQAIDAYHRMLHWGTYQTLDPATVTWLLNGWGEFKVRYPGHGKHAEGNLSTQLLALINDGHVYQIFPISSGKSSTPTVLGSFRVYLKDPSYLPDGMYFSNFFTGGYAIHGFNPAPDYPASHGCMRLPIGDAITVYNWLNIGDSVDVYY